MHTATTIGDLGMCRVAIDTEFFGPRTLLVQAATMLPSGRIAVQLYRSPGTPDMPADFDLMRFMTARPADGSGSRWDAYSKYCSGIIIRPVKEITERLSPIQLYFDLLDLSATPVLRVEGIEALRQLDGDNPPQWAKFDEANGRWHLGEMRLLLIGHFWPADFLRAFGSEYLHQVLRPDEARNITGLSIRSRKNLEIVEAGKRGFTTSPVVQYARTGNGELMAVRAAFFDTSLPMGEVISKRLHDVSKALIEIGKVGEMTKAELENMEKTFLADPRKVYEYSVVDAINTLLCETALRQNHDKLYQMLKVPVELVPVLAQTAGRRTADALIAWSMSRLTLEPGDYRPFRRLLKAGGIGIFEDDPHLSRFGRQTASTQGGLLYNRSPQKLYHHARGAFADVDLSSAYSKILQVINIYLGTPIIWEPGGDKTREKITVKQAVETMHRVAPDDAWLI